MEGHLQTWFIQTKADKIQGFSRPNIDIFQGLITKHEVGSHDENLVFYSQILFFYMIFTFILPCEQKIINNKNFFIQLDRNEPQFFFNNEYFKPKNHFSRLFKIYFFKFKAFQGLENCFLNLRLFKGFQGLCEPCPTTRFRIIFYCF